MFRGPSPYSKRGRFSIFRFVMLGLVFDGFWNGLGHCFCTFFCETKASRGALYSKTNLYGPTKSHIFMNEICITQNCIQLYIILNYIKPCNSTQPQSTWHQEREKAVSRHYRASRRERDRILNGSSVGFFWGEIVGVKDRERWGRRDSTPEKRLVG